MANKVLSSQLLVVVLQYGMLLLLCFFLYRVIRITYLDFNSAGAPILSAVKSKTGRLTVLDRGFLVQKQTDLPIGDTLNIGRNEKNEVIINESTVSHEHAYISYYQNHYVLSDLNSTNGTRVNDVPWQADTILRKGDKIQIGSTIFQFEE